MFVYILPVIDVCNVRGSFCRMWHTVYVSSSCLQLFDCSGIMDKVCAFCSRGEKSLLGQGELTCNEPTSGFNPFKRQLTRVGTRRALSETDEITGRRGQQSLTWRRTRGPLRQQSRYANRSYIVLYSGTKYCCNVLSSSRQFSAGVLLCSFTVSEVMTLWRDRLCILLLFSCSLTCTDFCDITAHLFCRMTIRNAKKWKFVSYFYYRH